MSSEVRRVIKAGKPSKGINLQQLLSSSSRSKNESTTRGEWIISDDIDINSFGEGEPTRVYKSHVNYFGEVNKAIIAIFFNYFNIRAHEKGEVRGNSAFEFKNILNEQSSYIPSLPDTPSNTFSYTAIISFDGIDCAVVMEAYRDGGEIRNVIRISSDEPMLTKSLDLYEMLFKEALVISNLKGSYVILNDNGLSWKIGTLKELSFDDVFLPKGLMDDLIIYNKLFETKGMLQRFMFNGIPGTGKTESTRAISSLLNKQGVTIIKTNICDIIKQKFDLAKILAPALIILDDIDLYLGDRNHGGVSPRLGDFLDILDGVDKLPNNVGVIATTNAPHLIDLAAQRPGRFNRLLFFDELTEENIASIINKSLNSMSEEFGNITDSDRLILSNPKLISFFKKSGCTGAFIYETVKNIKYKIEILGGDLNLDDIITEIKRNNEMLAKKLKINEIKTNFGGEPTKMGYGQ